MPDLYIGEDGAFVGDSYVGGRFEFIAQLIAAGLDSNLSEATGWDAVVKPNIPTASIVRTSDTVVTITLPAFATYNITAAETITATVPAGALVSGGPLIATPTFDITAGAFVPLPAVPSPNLLSSPVMPVAYH